MNTTEGIQSFDTYNKLNSTIHTGETNENPIEQSQKNAKSAKKLTLINQILEGLANKASTDQEEKMRLLLNKKTYEELKDTLLKVQTGKINLLPSNKGSTRISNIQKELKELQSKSFTELGPEGRKRKKELKSLLGTLKQSIQIKVEKKKVQNRKHLEKILDIKNALPESVLKNQEKILSLLNEAQNTDGYEREKILEEILKELKNPSTLKIITEELQKQDRKNGTKSYEAFRNTIIKIDSNFTQQFDSLEAGIIDAKLKVGLGNRKLNNISITKKGTISQKTDDGYIIHANNTQRTIQLEGSTYKFIKNIPLNIHNYGQ